MRRWVIWWEKTFSPCIAGKSYLQINKNNKDTQIDEQLTFTKQDTYRTNQHLGSFLGGSVAKNLPANAGVRGLIPSLGRSPGEGNGNPLQYSCLGDPTDKRAWWGTVHSVTKESDMT